MSKELNWILNEYIDKFIYKNPSKKSNELFNNIIEKLKKIPSKNFNNLINNKYHDNIDKK